MTYSSIDIKYVVWELHAKHMNEHTREIYRLTVPQIPILIPILNYILTYD